MCLDFDGRDRLDTIVVDYPLNCSSHPVSVSSGLVPRPASREVLPGGLLKEVGRALIVHGQGHRPRGEACRHGRDVFGPGGRVHQPGEGSPL